jgi:hypothetical protein
MAADDANKAKEAADDANKATYLQFLYVFGDIPDQAYAKFIHDIQTAIQEFNVERHTQYAQGKRGQYTYTPQPFQGEQDQFMFEVVYPRGASENQADAGIDLAAVDIDIRLDIQGVDRLQFMFEGDWNIACKDDERKSVYLSLNKFLETMNQLYQGGLRQVRTNSGRVRARVSGAGSHLSARVGSVTRASQSRQSRANRHHAQRRRTRKTRRRLKRAAK